MGPPVRILLRSNSWCPPSGRGPAVQVLKLRIINDDDCVFLDASSMTAVHQFPLPATLEEYLATSPRAFELLTRTLTDGTEGPVGGLSTRQRLLLREFVDVWIRCRSPRFKHLIQYMVSIGARVYPPHEPVSHVSELDCICALARVAFPISAHGCNIRGFCYPSTDAGHPRNPRICGYGFWRIWMWMLAKASADPSVPLPRLVQAGIYTFLKVLPALSIYITKHYLLDDKCPSRIFSILPESSKNHQECPGNDQNMGELSPTFLGL
ncbi:hypothetical protein FKP32DRAFT_1599328 [Trametes sanguinea]|nr:hypothetical protein FKP32DRAFT_1599328 [Trametes sanguinea]